MIILLAVFEKIEKYQESQHWPPPIGECLEFSDDVRDDMRRFVLLKIYRAKETTCAETRAAKWRKMKKKCLACFPPDEYTLHHHLDHVSYLSYLLKHYQLDRHLSPAGHGWEHINGKWRPVR